MIQPVTLRNRKATGGDKMATYFNPDTLRSVLMVFVLGVDVDVVGVCFGVDVEALNSHYTTLNDR
jgi:hypothetical protein